MRASLSLATLMVLLGCQRDTVGGPAEWQALAQKEMTERLRTEYDTIYEDVGFIKASFGSTMDVYEVENGKVGRCFSYKNGEGHGYSFEWYPDGALWFVSSEINGEEDGTAVEFNYERGQQYIREYKLGELLSTDSILLTDRPRIELYAPPTLRTGS